MFEVQRLTALCNMAGHLRSQEYDGIFRPPCYSNGGEKSGSEIGLADISATKKIKQFSFRSFPVADPVQFAFFCVEGDYPKFLTLFPEKFPPTYREFVVAVDQSIANQMEQVTIKKTNVGFDEFLSFCERRKEVPNYSALIACTFHAWGRNG